MIVDTGTQMRCETALRSIRHAEGVLEVTLAEAHPNDPTRSAIAAALERVRAAALALGPTQGERC